MLGTQSLGQTCAPGSSGHEHACSASQTHDAHDQNVHVVEGAGPTLVSANFATLPNPKTTSASTDCPQLEARPITQGAHEAPHLKPVTEKPTTQPQTWLWQQPLLRRSQSSNTSECCRNACAASTFTHKLKATCTYRRANSWATAASALLPRTDRSSSQVKDEFAKTSSQSIHVNQAPRRRNHLSEVCFFACRQPGGGTSNRTQ